MECFVLLLLYNGGILIVSTMTLDKMSVFMTMNLYEGCLRDQKSRQHRETQSHFWISSSLLENNNRTPCILMIDDLLVNRVPLPLLLYLKGRVTIRKIPSKLLH
jgi:hypothetical protein